MADARVMPIIFKLMTRAIQNALNKCTEGEQLKRL